jgi:hypothetical protein
VTSSTEADARARESALWLVNYFAQPTPESLADVWTEGLTTAREWLRLIEAPSVTVQDLSGLLRIASVNSYRGSGWNIMAIQIHQWATAHAHPVPSLKEFLDTGARHRQSLLLDRRAHSKKWWHLWK